MTSKFRVLSEEDKRYYLETMKLYSDTAKTFTQLSVGALVLPIVFARQILALDPKRALTADPLLVVIWGLFLAAIGSGLFYQYLAVKFLSANYWKEDWEGSSWFVREPGYIYGAMMLTFFMAAFLFVVRAYSQFVH